MRLKSFNLLKAASMRQRSLYRRLLNVNGSFLLERFGMTGLVQCSSRFLAQLGTIICCVTQHAFCRLHSTDQALCDRTIVCFTPGQQDRDQAPFSIRQCMDLRVAPSARAANSLLFLPPFPPLAERCAFTCVESIICVSKDRPLPASCRNRFSQMPRRAHRTKRL